MNTEQGKSLPDAHPESALYRAETPAVSVVVATRNRPRDLARFLESARLLSGVPFEVIIADQSDGHESAAICEGFADWPPLRYLKCEPRGKSAAVNQAVALARGDVLALTDDDCTPMPDWLRVALDTFSERPHLALLFGEFVPIEHNPAVDWIPWYHIETATEYRKVPRAAWESGLGGNTVITRKAFLAVGGMDEQIGPGALSRSGNDYDLNYRVVDAGFVAADVPSLIVRHWGARKWDDGSARKLRRDNFFGQGVTYAKRTKCRDLRGISALARQTLTELNRATVGLARLQRPTGLRRLVAMYSGFLHGLRLPVDRTRGMFRISER